jgi:deoxycytidylate deaminase
MITNVKMIKKIEYYLKIASQVAEAWTCNRAKVWAVIEY